MSEGKKPFAKASARLKAWRIGSWQWIEKRTAPYLPDSPARRFSLSVISIVLFAFTIFSIAMPFVKPGFWKDIWLDSFASTYEYTGDKLAFVFLLAAIAIGGTFLWKGPDAMKKAAIGSLVTFAVSCLGAFLVFFWFFFLDKPARRDASRIATIGIQFTNILELKAITNQLTQSNANLFALWSTQDKALKVDNKLFRLLSAYKWQIQNEGLANLGAYWTNAQYRHFAADYSNAATFFELAFDSDVQDMARAEGAPLYALDLLKIHGADGGNEMFESELNRMVKFTTRAVMSTDTNSMTPPSYYKSLKTLGLALGNLEKIRAHLPPEKTNLLNDVVSKIAALTNRADPTLQGPAKPSNSQNQP